MVMKMNKRDFCIFPKNRRGWIEIVEAFLAVLLVAAVLLIVINKQSSDADISETVYDVEVSILREIQTNDTLRRDIASAENLPLSWIAEGFPVSVKEKITDRTPAYLDCVAVICVMNTPCVLGDFPEAKDKNIYSQSVVISPTVGLDEVYRQLNIFCWTK